jgi:lactate racemase
VAAGGHAAGRGVGLQDDLHSRAPAVGPVTAVDPGTVDVRLAFGDGGLPLRLPASSTTVVEPRFVPAAPDQRAVLATALRRPVAGAPLRELVRPGQTVAISVCDITRPQPRRLMVPAVLDELDGVVRLEDVVVLVATGTHRTNTDAELRAMLGDAVVDAVRVVNHDSRDASSMVWRGRFGADVPVWLAREWVEADVRITTGFVEPHFFAGFSGGPKMVAPGLAALETVLVLHDARRIGDPRATWGVREGNPVHDDIRAIAAGTGAVDLAFDVVLNRDQDVVAAYAGPLSPMHDRACARVREVAMREVDGLFDVVVTSNAGYPLDQNLYQAVKGMSAAAQVVRPGGLIVSAAQCRDGFPDHGPFRSMLEQAPSPEELMAGILEREQTVPDQWQAQVLAKIQGRARVAVHTEFLSDADLAAASLRHVPDVTEEVMTELARVGPGARVCVLPEGPQTVPYLA